MTIETGNETTHFGYQEVPRKEKAAKVRAVFDGVASQYDLMNDLMSFGLHRLWKLITVELSIVKRGHCVLDLAGGTGDLARRLASKTGPEGQVVLADINAAMLSIGRDKMIDLGLGNTVAVSQVDAQALPFANNSFHCVTMAFGLRNVTDKAMALRSIARCLRPGGQCLILEFSHATIPGLSKLYDAYSFGVIPFLGKFVAGDKESYQYLVESIRKHPNQETLASMMRDAGFDEVKVTNFAGGIVALHRGFKY